MARACRDPLGRLGIDIYAQEADGSRAQILERFRDDPSAALFGAASFWQGVDVPGDTLRNVIITRLPFDPPDRPLAEARAERLKEMGKDPFREDSLPRAVIRFKQGFGRRIRSTTDRGVISVLDSRILTKRYGKIFLKSQPEVDRAKLEELRAAELALAESASGVLVEALADVAEALTPAQRAELLEHASRHRRHRGHWRH